MDVNLAVELILGERPVLNIRKLVEDKELLRAVLLGERVPAVSIEDEEDLRLLKQYNLRGRVIIVRSRLPKEDLDAVLHSSE